MSKTKRNPCPECGKEMDCMKVPEIGSPYVGRCSDCGWSWTECEPPPG